MKSLVIEYAKQKGVASCKGIKGYNDFREFLLRIWMRWLSRCRTNGTPLRL